jgi:NADP-dependent 3-hydroxy acid dehydrogenase YdfG
MAKQPRVLVGQLALITGGGRGIGAATARALVREGMKVAIGDLDSALAERTAAEIGGGTIGLPLDVTNRDSFEAFVSAAEEKLGPMDVIVNNAGIMPIGPFIQESDEVTRAQIEINIMGVEYGCKIALGRFLSRGRGHIVNIASTAGKIGLPGGATYCGTKHFVVGLSEAIRQEVRGTAIEVACVMPGVVNTELATGLKEARGVKNANPEDVAAEIVSALKSPRFDVYVPRHIGGINKTLNLLPRGTREGIARGLKVDQVLANADSRKRLAYEGRASQSAPAALGGSRQAQVGPPEAESGE